MTPSARRAARLGAVAACVVATLAVLRPWTIVPLETARPQVFDARAYALEAWPRVVAEAEANAVLVFEALGPARASDGAPPSGRALFVRAVGTLTEVDRRSRVGLARLQVERSPDAEVAIQVGPVLRGTAVRDAASFVQFTDFANQTEFAAVSNALNELVASRVLEGVDIDALRGRRVAVIGAATVGGARAGAPVHVIPLRIDTAGGDR
jgi:predicted lipoprotein